MPGTNVLRFLEAHNEAPGRAMTATRLSEAAGYQAYGGVCLQYGLLANKIGAVLKRRNANLQLLVEFVRPGTQTNKHWILVMRPEFAEALEELGWV